MNRHDENSAWKMASDILSGLLPQLTTTPRWREYQVWQVWEEVVGEALARKARPSRIQNGKLFVTVSHPILMQELQFAKVRIRDGLNRKLGAGIVKDLQFFIGQVRELPRREPIPRQLPLPPFSELQVPVLEKENAELTTALKRVLDARRRRLTRKGIPHV
jgi:hypothetical protein